MREDLVQDALVWVLQENREGVIRVDTYDRASGDVEPWAFVLAHYAVLEIMKRFRGTITHDNEVRQACKDLYGDDPQADVYGPEDTLDGDVVIALRQVEYELTEEERLMLRLRYEGATWAKIAEELGDIAPSTAANRHDRAKTKARRLAAKYGLSFEYVMR